MPLATLWTEAEFIRERDNAILGAQAILTHAAIVDAIGGGGHLKRVIEDLRDG